MNKFRMWVPKKQRILPIINICWTEDHERLDSVGMSIFENEPWDEDWFRDLYPEDVIIMESTGYYDANDIEIYEGDILIVSPKVDSTNSGVKGLREDCPLVVESIEEWYKFWYVNYYHFFAFIPAHLLEVVGNIYENPELRRKNEID